MPIPLFQYAQIKDNYCFAYYGSCNEYLVQLLYIRDFLEDAFQGTNIYISCRDNVQHLVEGHKNIIFKSNIQESKKQLAYIREITSNCKDHPILSILEECDIQIKHKPQIFSEFKNYLICPQGSESTSPLTIDQIKFLEHYCNNKGYKKATSIVDAGWVLGTECEDLYRAAAKGIKTSLVPTGIGTTFYKKLFCPNGEILNI